MGAVPQHPFFLRVLDSLQAYNKNWLLPYITVMYSTGPLFLSVIWKEYMLSERDPMGRVRILMPDEYNRHAWSFFIHHQGSSWHGKDARLIFWVRPCFRVALLSSFPSLARQLTSADGFSLGASHNSRFPFRRCSHLLPLVGVRPS